MNTRHRPTTGRRAPASVGALAVLAGLWAFAVAQPLLALLGDEPGFFVVRQAGAVAIIAFALFVVVVGPLVLWMLGAAVSRIHRRAGEGFHLATVVILAALAVIPVVGQLGAPAVGVILGLAAAVAFGLAYWHWAIVATWARYTVILPVMALVWFVALSPSGQLVTATGGPNTGDPSTSGKPSVLFLMLDELPTVSILDESGAIDPVRFPNLAAFGTDATWYRNQSAVANATAQSVPAMLSGKLPTDTEPLAAEHPDNLFSLLAPTHRLDVSESFTALCGPSCEPPVDPPSLPSQVGALAEGGAQVWKDRLVPTSGEPAFDDFVESVEPTTPTHELFGAPSRFTEFMDTVEPTDEPTLWFLHLILPHKPWFLYPDGQKYLATDFPALSEGPWVASLLEQRHLYQARYGDRLVGELLDRLREIGEYDDTLIVIAADHGEAFQPDQNSRRWSPETASEVAFSPLLIKAPGQETGRIDDQNLLGVDILPTIADLLGIEVPWATDGAAAGDPAIAERGGRKWIYDFGSEKLPTDGQRFEFDLADNQPSADERWIGPRQPDRPPLTSLLEPLEVDEWLGQPLDVVVTGTGSASATLAPDLSGAGFVQGTIEGAPEGARLLVAVDGTIVSASPIVPLELGPTSFVTLVPEDVSRTISADKVQLAVVDSPAGTPPNAIELATIV